MKTAKRIVSILLLIILGLLVGYLIYTGSRLPSEAVTDMSENVRFFGEGVGL